MDLESGCPFWLLGDVPAGSYAPLDRDGAADVVIIGGGISGACCAHYLSAAGAAVVLLDRRPIAEGSTAAATALVQYEVDLSLGDLSERLGVLRAARAYRACREALDEFEALAVAAGDVGFARRPSLYLASSDADAKELVAECARRRRIGLEVDYLDRGELERRFGFARSGALLTDRAAEVDPVRFTRALVRRAAAGGAVVHTGTGVTRVEAKKGGARVITDSGAALRCRSVVMATGYETAPYLPSGLFQLRSTYALATPPAAGLSEWPDSSVIWETARPYFYCRRGPGGRIIAGGEDEDYTDAAARDSLIPDKRRRLLARLRSLVPDAPAEAHCAWAGVFAESADSLPFAGSLPEHPHVEFALAYGANGILFSVIIARIVRDRILGRRNADEALFGFGRVEGA